VAQVRGVESVHHVHAWSLTPERPMLTLHARIADLHDSERITHAIRSRLQHRFGVDHVTVQIERALGAAMEGCGHSH
jgi:cobalt-zinc-cadmium efflux system protein